VPSSSVVRPRWQEEGRKRKPRLGRGMSICGARATVRGCSMAWSRVEPIPYIPHTLHNRRVALRGLQRVVGGCSRVSETTTASHVSARRSISKRKRVVRYNTPSPPTSRPSCVRACTPERLTCRVSGPGCGGRGCGRPDGDGEPRGHPRRLQVPGAVEQLQDPQVEGHLPPWWCYHEAHRLLQTGGCARRHTANAISKCLPLEFVTLRHDTRRND